MDVGLDIGNISNANNPEKDVKDAATCYELPNECSQNVCSRKEALVSDLLNDQLSVHHQLKTVDTISEHNSAWDEIESITDTETTCGQPVCRICLENGNEPLVAPCKCDGSTKFIHETCLLTWFHKTRHKKCEICLSKVNIMSTGCKPINKWRIPKGTYNFVFYFYVIYALATFCTSGIAFTVAVTSRCATPTCIALYIACILSILSLVYCAGFTIYIKLFWKAAITTNKNWKVYNRVSFTIADRNSCDSITDRKHDSESLKNSTFANSVGHTEENTCIIPTGSIANNNKVPAKVSNNSVIAIELCFDEHKSSRGC